MRMKRKHAWDGPTIQETAYHEAGHAVMAQLLGAKIRACSIRPRNGRMGFVDVSVLREPTSQCLVELAGLAAEGIYRKRPYTIVCKRRDGTPGIRENSDVISAYKLFRRSPIMMEVLRTCWRENRRILRGYWKCVRTVAKALLKRGWISGKQLSRIVRENRP